MRSFDLFRETAMSVVCCQDNLNKHQ